MRSNPRSSRYTMMGCSCPIFLKLSALDAMDSRFFVFLVRSPASIRPASISARPFFNSCHVSFKFLGLSGSGRTDSSETRSNTPRVRSTGRSSCLVTSSRLPDTAAVIAASLLPDPTPRRLTLIALPLLKESLAENEVCKLNHHLPRLIRRGHVKNAIRTQTSDIALGNGLASPDHEGRQVRRESRILAQTVVEPGV